jgi:hypothetical protein
VRATETLVDPQPITSFQLIQLSLIVGGLLFTVIQLRRTAKAARVANLLALTKNHRELWSILLNDPQLRQILFSTREVGSTHDLSSEERLLVNFFLLHMATSFELQRARMITRNRATAADMADIICLPAFRVVWQEHSRYHPRRFQRYIERAIARRENGSGRRFYASDPLGAVHRLLLRSPKAPRQ